MRTIVTLFILAAAPGWAAAQASKEDLQKLVKAGLSDDVIIAYVKANGFAGKLSSDELIELKAAGVSDRVLAGVLTAGETAPVKVIERPASEPTTVYVERPPVVISGSWSVGVPYYYRSSYYYCPPSYRSYYSGYYSRPYIGGSYFRSTYCAPRHSFAYSRGSCRSGFGVRVRW